MVAVSSWVLIQIGLMFLMGGIKFKEGGNVGTDGTLIVGGDLAGRYEGLQFILHLIGYLDLFVVTTKDGTGILSSSVVALAVFGAWVCREFSKKNE